MFGRPVVHGVHVALWALDCYLDHDPRRLAQLDVLFGLPVFLDEQVNLVLVEQREDQVRLRVELDGRSLISLRLHVSETVRHAAPRSAAHEVELPVQPRDRDMAELGGQWGRLSIPTDSARREGAFERLADVMSERFVAELAALSRLVGMECPGLHSIFGGFSITADQGSPDDQLTWEVARTHPHFSALRMRVAAQALQGTINAFVRPKPVAQLASAELTDHIVPTEFSHVRALVVGGSRGLGELAAKLLAAGGADVTVTWHRGREDAESAADDIRSAGGTAGIVQLDITDPSAGLERLSAQAWPPTHLLYFASPRITARRVRMFDSGAFQDFIEAYVHGFTRTLEACRELGADDLVAFYPSSVAIDWSDSDLVEYVAAKAAGEAMAQALDRSQAWLDVLVERLPALPTDQTTTLTADQERADPLPLMIDILRRGRRHSNSIAEDAGSIA